jgi:hypothetical protein
MIVELATLKDLNDLMELFVYHELTMRRRTWCDKAKMRAQLRDILLSQDGLSFIARTDEGEAVGALVGLYSIRPTTGRLMFTEVHWMTRPDRPTAGLQLKRAAEKAARDAGAESFMISAPNEGVENILKHSGYVKCTTIYEREL